MFCKVCKDSGKNESVYTSHWVRDAPGPNGKVVCPTLLGMNCKYCREKGHMLKFCPKLKSKYRERESDVSTVKVSFRRTRTASEDAKECAVECARELCSSPPPPIGKKSKNYFQLLKVDEETGKEGIVNATLKDNYLDIAKKSIETFKREWVSAKDAEIKTYKEDMANNFPLLGLERGDEAMKTKSYLSILYPPPSPPTLVKSYSSVATAPVPATEKYKREDSPTPSPVSSRPHSPPPAPKKMPRIKEEKGKASPHHHGMNLRICAGCGEECYAFCTTLYCEGRTSSPQSIWAMEMEMKTKTSPPPTTTTTTTTTRWADMEE